MIKRTKLKDRVLPNYSKGEEIANMVTHIIGGAMGIVVLLLSIFVSIKNKSVWSMVSGIIYGVSMVILYTISSVYHGLKPSYGKKVMQVIDHSMIYLLIAGTYTPILLAGIRPQHPLIAWLIFGAQWGLAAFGSVFTSIDHNRYKKLSMICYIGMGWFIILALKPTIEAMGCEGFTWLIAGGVSYTVGAIAYGIGKKKAVFHTIFHILVDIGSILQAVCILKYVL